MYFSSISIEFNNKKNLNTFITKISSNDEEEEEAAKKYYTKEWRRKKRKKNVKTSASGTK